jgi:hypothetical protein
VTDFGIDAIGATYHRFPLDHKQWKTADWVFFWQEGEFGRTIVLLEFPKGSEVHAGTHSQLYFRAKIQSGEWVRMYLLSPKQLAKKVGYMPYLGKVDLKTGTPLIVGSYSWWSDFRQPMKQVMKGDLDEMRISKGLRTDEEIVAAFAQPAEFESDDKTIALWHFNDTSGPAAREASGNHALSLRNFGGKNPTQPRKDGRFGWHRYFNDSIMVTFPSEKLETEKLDAWTLEFWARFEDHVHSASILHIPPVRSTVVLTGAPGSGDDRRRGKLAVNAADPGKRGKDLHSKSRITDGKWHYIAVAYKRGGKIRVFIDGKPDAEIDGTGIPAAAK